MKRVPPILIVSPYYHPGRDAGGPVKSLKNLARLLLDEGRELLVITRDRDVRDAPKPFAGVEVDTWSDTAYGRVWYSASLISTLRALRAECRGGPEYGPILYLNSFFSPQFSVLAVVLTQLGVLAPRCIINSPRGEFAPSALAHKPWRKRAYLAIARALGLYRSVIWHATNDEEADFVRRLFGASTRVRVAANLSGVASEVVAFREKRKGEVSIAFVARVVPIKNLRFALEALRGVTASVRFDIFGPREDVAYCLECEKVVASLPPNISVSWMGAIDNEKIGEELARRDLLLLPTLGENFGHAIVEALQAGCAPIISDRTPWRGLEKAGAGWDLPLDDMRPFAVAVETVAAMEPEEAAGLRARAREYLERQPLLTGARRASLELFGSTD